jgi:hypothetical protein
LVVEGSVVILKEDVFNLSRKYIEYYTELLVTQKVW